MADVKDHKAPAAAAAQVHTDVDSTQQPSKLGKLIDEAWARVPIETIHIGILIADAETESRRQDARLKVLTGCHELQSRPPGTALLIQHKVLDAAVDWATRLAIRGVTVVYGNLRFCRKTTHYNEDGRVTVDFPADCNCEQKPGLMLYRTAGQWVDLADYGFSMSMRMQGGRGVRRRLSVSHVVWLYRGGKTPV